MNARRWLVTVCFLVAVSNTCEGWAADKPVWVATTNLEIIGAGFPTLPEPYVSVKLSTGVALDGVPVTAEARAATTQRVTLSVAEATALRDALAAWLANPTVTTTLLAKGY